MAKRKPTAWGQFKASQAVGYRLSSVEAEARRIALSTHIRQVRETIFLQRRTCQACSGMRWKECGGSPDQMHEDPSRSATRGQLPHIRFNERVCARLCRACHQDVTEKRIRLVKLTEAGFAGPIRVEKIDTAHKP